MNEAKVICLCGEEISMKMVGSNNSDGKAICKCGRHVTLHLRRHKKKSDLRVSREAIDEPLFISSPIGDDFLKYLRQTGSNF